MKRLMFLLTSLVAVGVWAEDGVVWNFPHHHRATTAMPIDWRAEA